MYREYYTTFQTRLYELYKNKKMGRLRLSQEINISLHTLNGYFKQGARLPEHSVMCSLAKYFNVDVGYLYGDQKPPRLETASISSVTGLSERAASVLREQKDNAKHIAVLEAILTSPLYKEESKEEFIEDVYRYLYESYGTGYERGGIHDKLTIIDNPETVAKLHKGIAIDTFSRLLQRHFEEHGKDISDTKAKAIVNQIETDSKEMGKNISSKTKRDRKKVYEEIVASEAPTKPKKHRKG